MRMSGHPRQLRRCVLLLVAGLLGAAVVVLPAVASSETSSPIEAHETSGSYGEKHRSWKPPEVAVSSGGTVAFSNTTGVAHGVEWRNGNPATPSCSGVPTTFKESSANWSGTCTFAQPGTYTFYCTVHGSEMTGTITVTASTTTGTTPTTTATTTASTTTAGAPGGGGPSPSSPAGSSASPLAGSAASAFKLSSTQHGHAVRGSVGISTAGAGGSLEVDLLVKAASLATGGHTARVRVGKLVLSHLHAGKNAFSVPLNSRARRALRRHGHLALSARMLVSPPGGSTLTITRSVLVHA